MLEDQRDALSGRDPEFSGTRAPWEGIFKQDVAAFAGAGGNYFGEYKGQAFADAGDVRDLAGWVAQDIDDTFGVTFQAVAPLR